MFKKIKTLCCFLMLGYQAIWTSQTLYADEVITIPDERFFPEGIAADGKGNVFVGSLILRQILHLDLKTHKSTIFVDHTTTDGLLSITGLLVDQKQNLLYACSTDAGVAEFAGAKVTSLFAFDLRTAKKTAQYPFPEGGFCNDMTLGPDGALYVTDTYKPRILVLRPGAKTLAVWVENEMFGGDGINLNGITWSNDQLYVVKSNSGELFRISFVQGKNDPLISRIILPRPLQFPDGLEILSKKNLIVVEGSGNLTEITINGNEADLRLISQGLDVPTTVEIIDGKAIVVQAQLDHLFDPEKAGAPAPFTLKIISVK